MKENLKEENSTIEDRLNSAKNNYFEPESNSEYGSLSKTSSKITINKKNKLESPSESFQKNNPIMMIKSPQTANTNTDMFKKQSSHVSEEDFNIENYMINSFFSHQKAEEARIKYNSYRMILRKKQLKIVEKIASQIECEKSDEKPGDKNNGSLFRLFNSDYFDMDFVMFYLEKHEENGISDTLINIVYEKFINESVFYLPQLCTMIIYKKNASSLMNYILDRSINQIKFSLQVHWLVSSYTESADSKVSAVFEKMLQNLEETMVNGRRNNISTYISHNKTKNTNENSVIKESIDKELRLRYFENVLEFYKSLKGMCEKLKEFPREGVNGRNAVLKNYIFTFNMNLINNRTENKNEFDSIASHFSKGIILPFDDSRSASDEDNSLIVRFIADQSFCFSTKARVPVKLCAEYIKVNECSKWDELYIGEEDDVTGKAIKIDIPAAGGLNIKSSRENSTNEFNKNRTSENFSSKENTENNSNLNHRPGDNSAKNENEKTVPLSINEFYMDQMNSSKNAAENSEEILLTKQSSGYYGNLTVKEEEDSLIIDFNPDVINPFGRKFSEVSKEIREHSPFRRFETYSIKNFIAKANDDLRQELMTMQLIKKFNEIFLKAEIPLKLHPYEILITSSSSGLLEFLTNTNSIDGVKKKLPKNWNLNKFYRNFFKENFEEAQKNFAESLAAYSLICYYLQIKDRHNGNILLDMRGCIIHIDFGFILGINPGNVNFEKPPFKLTSEYVEILDGLDSAIFQYYKSLMLRGMIESKRHIKTFLKIIEIMSKGSKMPCFEHADVHLVLKKFEERFHEKKADGELTKIVDDLIKSSYNNFWTNKYDSYQKLTNGILP